MANFRVEKNFKKTIFHNKQFLRLKYNFDKCKDKQRLLNLNIL